MKNILSVICLLVILVVLLPSCNKKEDNGDKGHGGEKTDVINDYLPLTVGAKYKYNFTISYTEFNGSSSEQKGECIWTFISKSVDTPVVYQVEQSFNGYSYNYHSSGQIDSSQIIDQISKVNFEVLKSTNVAFNFSVPYWGGSKVIFERFIHSDKIDTCLIMNSIIDRGCLRKNVGITDFFYHSCGNHCSSISYSFIKGPFY